MTITNLSELGGIVCVDGRAGEDIITAKATGSIKAGYLVSVLGTPGATQGDIVLTDVSVTEEFVGIVLPKYNVDCDTAVGDGKPVEVVRPKNGRKYNIKIKNSYSDAEIGTGGIFGTTEGEMDLTVTTAIGRRNCDITHKLLNTDDHEFTEVIWKA